MSEGVICRPQNHPCNKRGYGDHHHDRDEDAADTVGQSLDRRFASLCPLDSSDDSCQHGVGSDGRRPHHERAVAVERTTDDRCVDRSLDGHTLAGHHRFVDG